MRLRHKEKVYETIVNARIDACYLLVRELAESQDFNLDTNASTDIAGTSNNIIMSILPKDSPEEGPGLNLPVGTVEFLRLTTDKTLFQVFLGSPHWNVVARLGFQEGTAPLLDQLAKEAPHYVEAIWLAILGRFRSLQLVPSYRMSVGE